MRHFIFNWIDFKNINLERQLKMFHHDKTTKYTCIHLCSLRLGLSYTLIT